MTNTAEYVPDAEQVAAQNDAFRRNACLAIPFGDGDPVLRGRITVTRAVHEKGVLFVQACVNAIGHLTEFPPDNDPDGYHDFGSVEVNFTTVWFKIDVYDCAQMIYGSEAPDDPEESYRVLTILFPSDW